MKCQKCGKNEVNFHYSSNINGSVTQTYLCADCATESGYDLGSMFETDGFLGGFLPSFHRQAAGPAGFSGEFFPFTVPMLRFGAAFPLLTSPQPHGAERGGGCEGDCGYGKIAPETECSEVDAEMQKRREINMIREQMRIAAENDEFEKAIELREKIREMEA